MILMMFVLFFILLRGVLKHYPKALYIKTPTTTYFSLVKLILSHTKSNTNSESLNYPKLKLNLFTT